MRFPVFAETSNLCNETYCKQKFSAVCLFRAPCSLLVEFLDVVIRMIVEDVVTTGGSSLRAIEHVEAFGLHVDGVIAIIDRLEGGAEAFAERGYELRTLLTIEDLGIPTGDG